MTLGEAVRCLQKGELTAFRALYAATFRDFMFFALLMVKDVEVAQQVLIGAYADMLDHIEECDPKGNFEVFGKRYIYQRGLELIRDG